MNFFFKSKLFFLTNDTDKSNITFDLVSVKIKICENYQNKIEYKLLK